MRHDIIGVQMAEFTQTLADIAERKKEAQWVQVEKIIGRGLQHLIGTTAKEFVRLTETGMMAQLVKSGPTVWVPYKKIVLIALLKETGDCAATKRPGGGYGWYLKALHLLLDTLAHNELRDYTELAPTVPELLTALAGASLPVRTRLLLIREYERIGQFAKARDEFRAALERSPDNTKLLDFGIALFERLSRKSSGFSRSSDLPHPEIISILSELIVRRSQRCGTQPGTCE